MKYRDYTCISHVISMDYIYLINILELFKISSWCITTYVGVCSHEKAVWFAGYTDYNNYDFDDYDYQQKQQQFRQPLRSWSSRRYNTNKSPPQFRGDLGL